MMKWQPVSELTPEIVESAWRLIVWTEDNEWVFSRHNSSWGDATLRRYSDLWRVEEHVVGLPLSFITHFAVIDAPPEANMTRIHARNVDPDKVTDEEYYLWLMGIWGDETGQPEPDRWIASYAKRWHEKAAELDRKYNELLFRYCENDD